MTFLVAPVLNFFGSVFNKYLTDTGLKFVAFKSLLYTFLTVTLPAIFKNLLAWIFGLLTAQVDKADWGAMSSSVVELTGLAAWLAIHLRFVDCLAVLTAALVIRLTLNFISLVG